MIPSVSEIPHHISLESSPSNRGHALGRAHADAVRHTVEFYERLLECDLDIGRSDLRDAGRQVGELLRTVRPAFVDEIDAIASGAGVDGELLLAINARTELLANASYVSGSGSSPQVLTSECTVIGLLPEASASHACVLAQNWDFHPDLKPSRLLWTVKANGSWLSTFTEAGMLAKVGLNSHHVGVAINFLASDADTGLGGMPVHLLVRAILEDSTDLSSALRTIRSSSSRVSVCLTLGLAQGTEGALVSVESAPDGCSYVWPDDRGVLVHANHFLHHRGDDRYLGPYGAHGTLVRQWYAERALREPPLAEQDLEAVFGSRFNAPQAICRSASPSDTWLERSETLASLIMDLSALRLSLAPGQPGQVRYSDYVSPAELLRQV